MSSLPLSQRVSEEIRAHMARQRKTGVDLARHLHVSQQSASRRLTGETAFSLDEVARVAVWLGVEPMQLVPWSEPLASAG